ncbi:cysteine hydrolase family protein [Paenibacillus humicola]|uniref:cysteine hydrolase family protein n=1 Tax=Paenibacillus humicola TaxID=3110540 RepID=UPI00237BD8AA|nr:isochorismatase family cysteine hydrolase [Paenibacillus humicola]
MKYGNGSNYWIVEGDHFDVSRGSANAVTIPMEENRTLRFDPERSALIVIDMQNYFCSPKLERPDGALKLVPAIASAVSACRQLGTKIVWVNWGNRPDTANLPPSLLYAWKRNGRPGIGEPLPDDLGPVLVKDSWSAALADELAASYEEHDYWVDKYRISGFPGTVLDQILRANGINTLFFAGVNTDQCVMSTVQDASFLGYDSILLRDCTATTSPQHVLEGALYNMRFMAFQATSASLQAAVPVASA